MRKTILCIDDFEQGLSIRKLMLQAHGYAALTALSGPEGLALLESCQVELVILDYRMAAMHGGEVAQVLKQKRPQLPVIMLSGYASQVPASVRSLVDVFLQKGENVASLFAEIERLIGPGEPSGPAVPDQAQLMEQIRSLSTQNHRAIAQADKLIARNLRSAERRSRKPEEC